MLSIIKQIIFAINRIINFYLLSSRNIFLIKMPKIKGILYLRNLGEISIGQNVSINSSKHFNPIGGDTRTIFFTGPHGKIEIGNNVGISNSSLVSFVKITIEDNVYIGGGCKLYDTDFHPLSAKYRKLGNEISEKVKSREILIRSHAFIGSHSIILKGVVIGKNSIIGAGSVVSKSVPDFEIWAGNPAKFIRKVEND